MNDYSFNIPDGQLSLSFFADNGVRIRLSPDGNAPQTLTVPELPSTPSVIHQRAIDDGVLLSAPDLSVEVLHNGGQLRFLDGKGKLLMEEPAADARKTLHESVAGHALVSRRQQFCFSGERDSLHGLGHQVDAGWDFRGRSIDLLQENTTIVVPFLYNSSGCGILWDNASHSALGNPICPIPPECLHTPEGNPGGLCCELYQDADFRVETEKSVVPGIQVRWWAMVEDWHGHEDAPEKAFHARWTGTLRPRVSGEHRIYLDLPRGGRLWLDDDCVLDSRGSHKRQQVALPLAAERPYTLRLEAEQGADWLGAYAYLQWQEPVPSNRFSFWSQHAPAIDYYVISGSPTRILDTYSQLTGPAPLMPRYLFGYWQSWEHYKNRDELLGVVREHRERDIPLDVVVQDWRYWPDDSWGEPTFVPERFPDAPGMMRELHEELDCHLVLSNYIQIAEKSPLYKEFNRKNYLLPNARRDGACWVDVYNPEAVRRYWECTREVFFDAGVDIFWLDTTEPKITHPLTPDALLKGLEPNYLGASAPVMNAFSLYLCKGYYEAQRAASSARRVCLHPRSGFAGQQRYAAAVWTGDTGGTWAFLHEQVRMGLNMALSGIPYWNTDIGGFFGGKPQDPEYAELFVRWFQFATFCPIMRNHGTNFPKEIWRFSPENEQILRNWIDLHYQLLPYFYSLAWENHRSGAPFLRPLLFEFPDDPEAVRCADSFLLGPSLMVSPVTHPGCREQNVYLPGDCDWVDFWTGERHAGGQKIRAQAPLDRLPLFLRAGSLLPLEPNHLRSNKQYTGEELELWIVPGRDAGFLLYEDTGDGYAYESGERMETPLHWNQEEGLLSIGPESGSFPGAPKNRTFHIRIPGNSTTTSVSHTPGTVTRTRITASNS